jgi:cell division protein FtsI/penicillin-binding protein 2
VGLPLRFRALSNRYAPGSTIKPFVCLTGLASGVIDLDSREQCTGYLLEEHRDRWRCWQMHGTSQRKAHGDVDVVEALTGSCNIFMYRLGEYLSVDALTSAFDMVGVGKSTGIGFVEEAYGINPTSSWLATHKGMRTTAGLARLYAIGQGELSMTPLQVANLMATYASGRYREVTLVDSESEKPSWTLPGDRANWQAIRRGMYGVVNDPDGTAYQFAHFVHDRYALIGKTGSATAYAWPTSYTVGYVDESGQSRVEHVNGGSRSDAMERFSLLFPSITIDAKNVEVATRWPAVDAGPGEDHSHAWFGGYLQRLDDAGQPDWATEPRIAFAALVEFGGSGGRTSGPLGRRIAATIIETFREDLRTPVVTGAVLQP